MPPGPRIYNLFPLLAGPLPGWPPHLRRAAAMGFTWVFVNPFHLTGFSGSLYAVKDHYAIDPRLLDGASPPLAQLRGMLRTASDLGLRVMMDLVINHTALDSPLVREHPDWFRRDPEGRIVHPGARDGPRRVVWRDLAEVDNAGSADREALWAYWRRLALHYADLGVEGFRCDAAYQVPPGLWQELIGSVRARHPDVRFFAETLGCTPQETLRTAEAGFDFIFNSSKWWNFRDAWCLEQYAQTAARVASISFPESHDTPRLAEELNGQRDAVLQRYAFAATFSTGVMMPMGFEYGFRKRLDVAATTPRDWEAPAWDIQAPLAAVNRSKALLRPLNEEGPIEPLDLPSPQLFAFRKRTRDGTAAVVVILNCDRQEPTRVDIRWAVPPDAPVSCVDPLQASFRRPPQGEPLRLEASGILLLADPAAAAGQEA